MKTELMAQIAEVNDAEQAARHESQRKSEEVLKRLLFSLRNGFTRTNGDRIYAVQEYSCQNLRVSRTVKRGCVKWRKTDSFFSFYNFADLETIVSEILSSQALEQELSERTCDMEQARRSLEKIQSVYSLLQK